jgi:hypothetical protein
MIVVDSREPEKIGKYLKDFGVEFSFNSLPMGDIVDDKKGICIERKAYPDLVSSAQSGHLNLQLTKISANYDYCYLFISGKFEDVWNFSSDDNCKLISDLLINFPKVNLAFFPNDRQLVHCAKLVLQNNVNSVKNNCEAFSTRVLCSFDGIGSEIAKQSAKDMTVYSAIDGFLQALARCNVKRISALAKAELER